LTPPTIRRDIQELKNKKRKQSNRIRKAGGSRKKATDHNPHLIKILPQLIEPETRGDPKTTLRWTCKSVRNIAQLLQEEGLDVCPQTVATLLRDLEYSLQGNRKTKEGGRRKEDDHVTRKSSRKTLHFTRTKSNKI